MAIQIIKKNQQARGQFNGGEILENKPIGFPREGGHLKPYSNLFYWAHAWSDQGSTIGLHPHQGFEIMSFVLEGSIEHFDTADKEWKPLQKGGAQIIRAGNGISHSEKLNPGAHMFQIWFDPNLNKTIQQDPSYNDYPASAFPIDKTEDITVKTYKGVGSSLQMDSPGVEIKEYRLKKGEQQITLELEKYQSFYIIEGTLELEKETLTTDDFFIAKEQQSVLLKIKEESRLFMVANPLFLNYQTYAKSMQ